MAGGTSLEPVSAFPISSGAGRVQWKSESLASLRQWKRANVTASLDGKGHCAGLREQSRRYRCAHALSTFAVIEISFAPFALA